MNWCETVSIAPDVGQALATLSSSGQGYDTADPRFSVICTVLLGMLLLAVVTGLTWLMRCHRKRLQREVVQKAQALRESEYRYEMLAAQSGTVVWHVDREGRYVFLGNSAKSVYGYDPEELIGKYFYDLAPASRRQEIKEKGLRLIRSGQQTDNFENQVVHKDGRELWMLTTLLPSKDKQGRITGIYGWDTNITERKKEELRSKKVLADAEESRQELLRAMRDLQRTESERSRLALAVAQSPESIVITDAEGTIEYVNPAFEKITGYRAAEVIGKNPSILKSGEQDDTFYADLWQTISSGKTWKRHMVNRHKAGRFFTEEATIAPMRDDGGHIKGYIGIKRDVTMEVERERMQQQVQKMNSIGRLAGGIAHDFNNMLQVILGNTELAIESARDNELLREDLEEVRSAAKYSAELTRKLLAFASRQSVSPQVLSLSETLADSINMLRRLIHEDITLELNPGSHEDRIKMDTTQLNQVLINLCLNASDAIDGRGHITIAFDRRRLTGQEILSIQTPAPGEYVVLSVTDDGCGMDEQTRERVFEPFFTTKKTGKGVGLGLSTVYGIMKQNDGCIDVHSAPGKGTRLDLYFPVCKQPALRETVDEPGMTFTGPGGGILLVEDEEGILRITERMLMKMGCRVWSSSSPGKALKLFEEHRDEVDMLLTDVIMPEMNGKELADKVTKLKPNVKCVFMSGYSEEVIARNGIVPTDTSFIEKPFDAGRLHAVIDNAFANNDR